MNFLDSIKKLVYKEHNTIVENDKKTEENNKKLLRTNILTIDEVECDYNSAYFKDGIVYVHYDNINEESIIGKYDSLGKVYDTDGYEIGSISIIDENSALIYQNRLGDLKRYLESMFDKSNELDLTDKEKELYTPIARKTNIVWGSTEVWKFGGVSDLNNNQTVANPEYVYETEVVTKLKGHKELINDDDTKNNLLGYGACFVCLQYKNSHGKYADFYCCPIGKTFEIPKD